MSSMQQTVGVGVQGINRTLNVREAQQPLRWRPDAAKEDQQAVIGDG